MVSKITQVQSFQNKEEPSVQNPLCFLEVFLRISGIYFDPLGKRSIYDSKSRWRRILNMWSSLHCVVYTCLTLTLILKTVPLFLKEDEYPGMKFLVASFFLQVTWIFSLSLTMAIILPRHVPTVLNNLNATCQLQRSVRYIKPITTLLFIGCILLMLFTQWNLLNSTPKIMASGDRIKTFPFAMDAQRGRIVAYAYTYFAVTASQAFMASIILTITTCSLLGREFVRIKNRLYKLETEIKETLVDDAGSELEAIRNRFENICSLMSEADGFIKYATLVGFLFGVLIFCFALYCIFVLPINREEKGGLVFMLTTSVPTIVGYAIVGSYLNDMAHSVKDVLLKLRVDDVGERGFRSLSLFLQRVSGAPIGITMFGTFTIDRTSTLTVLGTVLSYGVLVVQLTSTNQDSCVHFNSTIPN